MSETVNHDSFADLFAGSDKAFGKCIPKDTTDSGKRAAKYWYEKRPVTDQDWRAHFGGEYQIGMPPIRSDNHVRWGAIDVDLYGLDYNETQAKIEELKLPLVICLSKSGGMHIFLFLQDWIPASEMIEIMDSVAGQLGFGACEIFPKQSRIMEGESDFGNFLNLPYFLNGQDGQVALAPDGSHIESIEDFVTFAQMRRIQPEDLRSLKIEEQHNEILPDGPPCLNCIYAQNEHNGIRNTVLANTAVYLKKMHPDGSTWEDELRKYNELLKPPLERSEVENTIKSYKRDYYYQCSDPALKQYCNSSICRKRKFGVGNDSFLSNNRSLTKLNADPPIWFLDVRLKSGDNVRITLQTEELKDQKKFQNKCMEYLNVLPSTIKIPMWEAQIQQLLEHCTIIDMPEDASTRDLFAECLERFLGTTAGESQETDIARGLPVVNALHYYFRREDLIRFLEAQRFKETRSNMITMYLTDLGAQPQNRRLGGKKQRFWQIEVNWNGGEEIQFTVDARRAEAF